MNARVLAQNGMTVCQSISSCFAQTLFTSTFTPISEPGLIFKKIEDIATELEKDMKHCGWAGKTVTLHYKLDTHQRFTRARSLSKWVTTKEELVNVCVHCLLLCLRGDLNICTDWQGIDESRASCLHTLGWLARDEARRPQSK
jgi:hypothetical protein